MQKLWTIVLLLLSVATYGQANWNALLMTGGINAPTFFGSASTPADAGTNTATTTVVTPPSSMKSGDLVFMYSYLRASDATHLINATGGQSWTSNAITAIGTAQYRIFWCRFNGTWSASPSVDIGGTAVRSVIMFVFRPSATTLNWSNDTAQATTSQAAGTTDTITGITPNNNFNVTIAIWTIGNITSYTNFVGTGWVNGGSFSNISVNSATIAIAYQLQKIKAATGDVSRDNATPAGNVHLIKIAFNSHI